MLLFCCPCLRLLLPLQHLHCLQERFHDLVPALSRWSGTVVGLTLMAIGFMGIYETYFAGDEAEEHEEQELKLAMAGGL